MPEGRVVNNGGTLKAEYVISDQQGNARISFQENPSSPGTAIVTQENSYYGYGLVMANSPVGTPTNDNKHLYNGGSEWQNDFSNLPDYYQTFYRNYDAALGRFVGADPKGEASASLSSYQYAGNNPIMFNDPLGDFQFDPTKPGFNTQVGNIWADPNVNMGPTAGSAYNPNLNYGGPTGAGANQSYNAILWVAISGDPAAVQQYAKMKNGVTITNTSAIQGLINSVWNGNGSKIIIGDNGFWSLEYNNAKVDQYGDIQGKAGVDDMGYDKTAYKASSEAISPVATLRDAGNDFDPETGRHNLFYSNYIGPWNPRTYNKSWSYKPLPFNRADLYALRHDKGYDKLNITGAGGVFFDERAISTDYTLVLEELSLVNDPRSSIEEKVEGFIVGVGIGVAALPKTLSHWTGVLFYQVPKHP